MADDYLERVNSILAPYLHHHQIEIPWENPTEAKRQRAAIRQMQKELRLVKKEVGLKEQEIRASFSSDTAHIGTGLGAGVRAAVVGKNAARKMNTLEREHLRDRERHALAQYEMVRQTIDSALVTLDHIKLTIENWLAAVR
jgi:hypothetical protein